MLNRLSRLSNQFDHLNKVIKFYYLNRIYSNLQKKEIEVLIGCQIVRLVVDLIELN